MAKLVTPEQIVARTDTLAGYLEIRGWGGPMFQGTDHRHALPVLESMYRFGLKGRYASNYLSRSREIEGTIREVWRSLPQAHHQVLLANLKLREFRHDISYPIKEWTIEELEQEYLRCDRIDDTLNAIDDALLVGEVGLTGASAATGKLASQGVVVASRAAAIARIATPVGAAVTVFSIAALMISTAYLDGCMDDVREEMDRRIEDGEYTEQRKNAVLARAQTN